MNASAASGQLSDQFSVASGTLTFYGANRCTSSVYILSGLTSSTNIQRIQADGCPTPSTGDTIFIINTATVNTQQLVLETAQGTLASVAGGIRCGSGNDAADRQRPIDNEGIGLIYANNFWYCLESEPGA